MKCPLRKREWCLAILILVIAFAFQGTRGIFDTTEGRYALSAKEMVVNHNWTEPTLLGTPHWTKPPFAYWAIAAGIQLCGPNAWGARLFAALAFALSAFAVGWLGATLWDRRTGFFAALVYGTSFYPAGVANSVNTDTFLALWETLVVLCFWLGERAAPARARWWYILMWAALGFGFLTKGPPAFICFLPVLIFRWRDPERRRRPTLFPLAGLLLFLVIGSAWYLYEALRNPELLRYFIKEEIIARVASNKFRRHPEWYWPFVMYLPLMFFGCGLWFYYQWRMLLACNLFRLEGWRRAWSGRGPASFLLLWVVPAFVIFSLSKSRLPTYLLPLFPAVALAIGHYLARRWPESEAWPSPLGRIALAAAALILLGKALPAALPPQVRDMTFAYRELQAYDRDPQTRLVAFEMQKYLGLHYHAQRPIARTFGPGWQDQDEEERLPGEHLGDYLDQQRAQLDPGIKRYVFVAERLPSGADEQTLMQVLASRGLRVRQEDLRRHLHLYFVDAPLVPGH